jgi:pyridoxine 5'-phosphate synthase PdxJ
MSASTLMLGVNIDHVATLRQARGGGRGAPDRATAPIPESARRD